MKIAGFALAAVLLATSADAQIARRLGRIGPSAGGGASTPTMTDTSPLTSGTEGVAYTKPFTCTGGTAPYTWDQPTGTLPAGLTLSAAGVLSGTPTVGSSVGVAIFTIRCTDSAGMPLTDTESFQLTIGYGAPAFTTASPLSACAEDGACSRALACAAGLAPRTYTVISGALPTGLSMDTAGNITGTATEAGTASFTAQCQDALGATGSKAFLLTVTAAASGDCDGEGPDDYWSCIKNFSGVEANGVAMTANGWNFRSNTEIQQWGATADLSNGVYYTGTDTPDAARVTVAQGTFGFPSANRVRVLDPEWTTGEWFMSWEAWKTPSWRIGGLVCSGSGGQSAQKSWHIEQINNTGSSQLLDWEAQDQTDLSSTSGVGVTPIQIASITASGGVATATTTAPHGLSDQQTATIAGATNLVDLPLTSIATGANPTITTVSPHGLTGTLQVDVGSATGEQPNLSDSLRFYDVTVSGASTFAAASDTDRNQNLTTAASGGSIRYWPYSALDATITVTSPTTFTYPINNATYSTAATGSSIWVIGDTETQVTGGTDCARISVRLNQLQINTGFLRSNSPIGMTPQLNIPVVPCEVWGRYYWTIRFNAGDAWTCGAVKGNYELMSMWFQAEGQSPVVLYHDIQGEMDAIRGTRVSPPGTVQMRQGVDDDGNVWDDCVDANYTSPTLTNVGTVKDFYLEHNTSGSSCLGGYSTPRLQYFRNFVYAGTTTTGVITTSTTSIVINGTEVLGPAPKP